MIYNKEYFIKKFEAIPEEKWTTGKYENEEGQFCAIGHCADHEVYNLRLLYPNYDPSGTYAEIAVLVNDGDIPDFQQFTPKKRILAWLRTL